MLADTISEPPVYVAFRAALMRFPVLPVNPVTKKPLINDWPNKATCNPEEIEAYWNQYPNAMTGIVTGHASGIFILDFDVEDGEDLWEKVRVFEEAHGDLNQTLTVKTPSGGVHFYYRMPEGVDLRNSASKLFHGVDVRANGGYVVFAGSVRADGKKYEIIQRGE